MKVLLITGMILLQGMRLDPSDAVRTAIDDFAEACVAADVAALDELLADPYLHVDGASGAVLGRDAWLARVGTQAVALDAGTLVVDRYEVEDLTIRMRRDAANVTGIAITSGTRDGVPFSREIRFTNVWVKEGEAWKLAMFHDSEIPAP